MARQGTACKRHPELLGKRYKDGACPGCRGDQGRKYRALHPGNATTRMRKWRSADPDGVKANRHIRYLERREHELSVNRAWRSKNIEMARAISLSWNRNNKERHAENVKRWGALNADRRVASLAMRRATLLNATPSWANKFFIAEAYRLAKLREKICGGKWHVDHIVPLASKLVCGLHIEQNLQVIPGIENIAKGNRRWPDMPQQTRKEML